MGLDDLRAELMDQGIVEADLDPDPFEQFRRWFEVARDGGMHEPEAMVISTVGDQGILSSRYVLMRGWSDGGFAFYTNYESRKGRELAAHSEIAVCFPWHVLSRQIRVIGQVERISATTSDAYFAGRPRGSQIGAWASAQSTVIGSRDELDSAVAAVEARFAGVDVPRPPHWGGYRIVPSEFEFWQGRASRLHDRFRYRRVEAAGGLERQWSVDRLSP
ncbi:MAG: pyridoxamine 5'-phosphate oxidase [Actinomycetes bacterium]